ncbi:MAG: MarR family transcriptional regulator [Clostridia bacterium]|nr:MarR family transcriptional regulator [Clostridia bacterium]
MDQFDGLKLENQLCFPLYAAAREVIKQYHPFLESVNLTYTQYIVMMVLWSESKISVRDLCKKLYLDSGTLTPVLKSMEAKGLLSRSRSKEDERVLIVEITPEGYALREKVVDIPLQVGACIRLEPQEAVQLYQLLYKVLDGMENK